MAEINLDDIRQKSVKGVVALTSRTFILQLIALGATFVLTVLLDPAAFGVFYVVSAIINFLNYFSDIGLAAALVQKKEEPTREDLVTTFTIQQLLVGTAVVVTLVVSTKLAGFYKLEGQGLFLLRALAISFFLSSLKTIPSVILERKLDFGKLIVPQISETIVFYVAAILFALKGAGVASFAWAALLRGIVGTSFLYLIAPWKPAFLIRRESVKKLLSFGIPYQTNSFIALFKDDLLILFLGKILPLAQIGYFGWAKKYSEIALRLIMDNIIRVTFPTFSRLQHDTEVLGRAISKSLLFLSLLAFPIAAGMMFMMHPFMLLIPGYLKWEPGLFSFYLLTINTVLATISSPFVNALNATGHVRWIFYLMLFWTVLTWIFVPLGVKFFGYQGVAIAMIAIGLTSFLPYLLTKKLITVKLWKLIQKPVLATSAMVGVLTLLFFLTDSPPIRLFVGVPLGILTYISFVYFLLAHEIKPYVSILLTRQK